MEIRLPEFRAHLAYFSSSIARLTGMIWDTRGRELKIQLYYLKRRLPYGNCGLGNAGENLKKGKNLRKDSAPSQKVSRICTYFGAHGRAHRLLRSATELRFGRPRLIRMLVLALSAITSSLPCFALETVPTNRYEH